MLYSTLSALPPMSPTAGPSDLRVVLKRAALLAATNWPVVVIQFVAESVFKLLLAVPVVGGVLLVVLILGADIQSPLVADPRSIVTAVTDALGDQPGALTAFVLAFIIVLLGGSAFMFLVKGGTVTVLALAEAEAGSLERPPLRLSALERANRFSMERFTYGSAHLFRRYLVLGYGLLTVYAISAGAYLLTVYAWYRVADSMAPVLAWTTGTAFASAAILVWIAFVNLVYLLVQMTIAVEDCSPLEATRLMVRFLQHSLKPVASIFGVVMLLAVLATIASMVAAAGLGLISFVPLAGLAAFPLQAGAWLLRGLVFQYLGLTALTAYLTLYRRFRDARSQRLPEPEESRHAGVPAS